MSGISPGFVAFKLGFEICPIFLQGGVAQFVPGGILPIVLLTEAVNLPLGLLTGSENVELDDFFAHYVPIPGATIIANMISEYPFANQAVAANALIASPLDISLRMICPAKGRLGYPAKLATMLLLQNTLSQHNRSGGTYTICTPSYFYTNTIMLEMRDITGGETKQAQAEWQLSFRKPLLTVEAAQTSQNGLMRKLSNGTQIDGQPAWSGADTNIGQPSPLSNVPAGADAVGSSIVTATPLQAPSGFGSGP